MSANPLAMDKTISFPLGQYLSVPKAIGLTGELVWFQIKRYMGAGLKVAVRTNRSDQEMGGRVHWSVVDLKSH